MSSFEFSALDKAENRCMKPLTKIAHKKERNQTK